MSREIGKTLTISQDLENSRKFAKNLKFWIISNKKNILNQLNYDKMNLKNAVNSKTSMDAILYSERNNLRKEDKNLESRNQFKIYRTPYILILYVEICCMPF